MKLLQIVLGATLLLVQPASAETTYVTDQCEITLRTGESTRNKILRMLKSGDQLTVLGTNSDSGYTHVRTRGGKEGYVLTRLLDNQPVARDRLQAAEQKLADFKAGMGTAAQDLERVSAERDQLIAQAEAMNSENERLSAELEEIRRAAANTLAINDENAKLNKRIIGMERELQASQLEAESLRDKTARDWFVAGAGVIILGILIGLIAPRIRVRRKSSWDSF